MSVTGYYITCDDAICADCAPEGFASGDYSEWPGFESWETPGLIYRDSESDCPVHCTKCGALIPHYLTCEGRDYVADTIASYLAGEEHCKDVIGAWWTEYQTSFTSYDMRDLIDRAITERRD